MKRIIFAALLALGVSGSPTASAQGLPDWSMGPSASFARFGFDGKDGSSDPTLSMLNGGVGWTWRWNTPARSKDGSLAYVSLDLTALADLSTLPSSGGLSFAAGPSFLNGLLGLEAGVKLFKVYDGTPTEGLFTLAGGRRNVFFLLEFSVNVLFDRVSPPLGGLAAPPVERRPFNYVGF